MVWRAYSSQEIGDEKLTSECIMICNNPRNDMQGCAQAGMRGVLYDPQWGHEAHKGDLRIWSLQAIAVEADPSGDNQLVIKKVREVFS